LPRLLISAVGFGASSTAAAEDTPWSVYLTAGGTAVLDGGPYPDANPASQLLVAELRMFDAIAVAERLESVLTALGLRCHVETLGDA
jgi:hypothetical protein